MMEKGYKFRNGASQKEKYNIAQNESFVQIGVGIIILKPQQDPSHQFLCLFEPYSCLVIFIQ